MVTGLRPRAMRRLIRFAWLLANAACADAFVGRDAAGVHGEALRPDSPNTTEPPPRFGPADEVERYDSAGGAFRVHFTRGGEHAVPPLDEDGDGVPDYVQLLAAEYDAVGEFYAEELGFERPLSDMDVSDGNGGDGRFDVYVLDFPTSADGAFRSEQCLAQAARRCTGYMLHENDFDGRSYASLSLATRILASHEYFHAVQNAYHAAAGVVMGEGTAVWASEQYDPDLPDLESFAAGYLERTERSLAQEPTGPVDPFAYGSGLFFQFLSERYGQAVVHELWAALRDEGERLAPDGWPLLLDRGLEAAHGEGLSDAFAEFARWNLYTGGRADPSHAYARGDGYPSIAARALELPFEDESVRVFPLSVRYYSAEVARGGPVRLVLHSDTPVRGLRMLLARETAGRIARVETARVGATASVTVEGLERGDVVHAAVIDTRLSGQSARPAVCLGSPEQTEGCAPHAAEPDAGVAAASGGGDAGCSVAAGPGRDRGAVFGVFAASWVAGWSVRRRVRPVSRRSGEGLHAAVTRPSGPARGHRSRPTAG